MSKLNKKIKEKFENFFDWIKGAELVELETCNIKEDPIRPELDVKFRTSYGRKIFGVKYKKEICAIMCFGFTNEIPKTIEEFELMTKDAHLQSGKNHGVWSFCKFLRKTRRSCPYFTTSSEKSSKSYRCSQRGR